MFDFLSDIPTFFSFDALIVLCVFVVFLLYFGLFGKDDVVTSIKALYVSGFVVFFSPELFSFLPSIGLNEGFSTGIFFALLFLIVFFILRRNNFFESPMVPDLWEIGVFAVLSAGLFLVILARLMNVAEMFEVSELMSLLFVQQPGVYFWAFAPIGFWLIIRGD